MNEEIKQKLAEILIFSGIGLISGLILLGIWYFCSLIFS